MSVRLANVKKMSIDTDLVVVDSLLAQIEEHDIIDGFDYLGHNINERNRHDMLLFMLNGEQFTIMREEDVYPNGEQAELLSDDIERVENRNLRDFSKVVKHIDERHPFDHIINCGAFRYEGVSTNQELIFLYEGQCFLVRFDC